MRGAAHMPPHLLALAVLAGLMTTGCKPAVPASAAAPPPVEELCHDQRATPGFKFVIHRAPPDVVVPDGMVYVPGGVTRIGSEQGMAWENPPFEIEVKPFFLDKDLVTVAEFRRFVEAAKYVTQAEKFGDAPVFDFTAGEWKLLAGATWHHPFGPDAAAAPDDHPVTQVSWNDATAYATWAGKRLPTEVEWEHAARNAQNGGPRYAWGDELIVEGNYLANAWQGTFPESNTAADGYRATSPVGAMGRTPLDLSDMGGNVWQWCDDWFRPYADRNTPFTPDAASKKVKRGGSYLCDPGVCHGYRVSARDASEPDTGHCHTGFHCARDLVPGK